MVRTNTDFGPLPHIARVLHRFGQRLGLLQLLFLKAPVKSSQFFGFEFTGRSGDDVAEQRADDVSLVRLELQRIDQAAGDGGKCVAVKIAERGEPMALPKSTASSRNISRW